MRMNAKELIAEARVTAPSLPPAAAKLMSDMADRLDVQYAVIRESREQAQKLAAESDFNLHGAARELNTSWMMHKTMMGAQAALLCLSQGDIRSARDWLEGTTDEAFIEMPDDMTPAGLQAWFDSNMTSNDGGNGFLTQEEALEKLRQRAPATDAAIAELRAEPLQSYADSIATRMKDKTLSMRQKERLHFAWADVTARIAELHNAQLRQSVQVKGVQS
ncbi:hypothetical protein SAMN04487787_101624 [Kosakonia sacchari]|nr:hypothetical protein SAMN04487787_101624 [Kosakonia sacchari]